MTAVSAEQFLGAWGGHGSFWFQGLVAWTLGGGKAPTPTETLPMMHRMSSEHGTRQRGDGQVGRVQAGGSGTSLWPGPVLSQVGTVRSDPILPRAQPVLAEPELLTGAWSSCSPPPPAGAGGSARPPPASAWLTVGVASEAPFPHCLLLLRVPSNGSGFPQAPKCGGASPTPKALADFT